MNLFRKKTLIIDYFILLFITSIGLWSFFINSLVVGDDLSFHINRLIGIADAFRDGQILPKIYPYNNNGFGYANPLFYCDLFLYPFALLYMANVPLVICYKMMIFFYTLLGNIFVYLIIKKESNNRRLGLMAALLYQGSNYRLQDIFIRSAFGEILAFTFIPLVLHSIYKILIKKENCWIYLGVSFSCLVMSHLITTLLYAIFFLIMIIVFVVVNRKDKEAIKNAFITIIKGTILAVFLTIWYLLPMFEQMLSQDFNYSHNSLGVDYSKTIQPVRNTIGIIFTARIIKYNASIGIILNLFFFYSFFKIKNVYITVITFIAALSYLILWGIIPAASILSIIQFNFRLLLILLPTGVIVAIYYLNLSNKKVFKALSCLIIVYTITNMIYANYRVLTWSDVGRDYLKNDADIIERNANNTIDYIEDGQLWDVSSLGSGEYLPYSKTIDYLEMSHAIRYVDNNGKATDYITENKYKREYTTIEFTCDNDAETTLLIPLTYYKGYQAYELVNGKWELIDFVCDDTYKQISFVSNKGEHTYKIEYNSTLIQNVSLIISSISLICLIIYMVKNKKNYYQ